MNVAPVKIAVVGMSLFATVIVLLGIAHVARRQEVIQLGYDLSKAIEALTDEQEENRRLRLEKSILTNPERIRRLAAQLGMAPPGPEQIRVVRAPTPALANPEAAPDAETDAEIDAETHAEIDAPQPLAAAGDVSARGPTP
ncbi:MAG: hypothetical protein Tsb0020_17180 [Haliangiales bacterium]